MWNKYEYGVPYICHINDRIVKQSYTGKFI